MHRPRRIPFLLGALPLAAALAGCSVSVVDTAKPSASPSPEYSADVRLTRPSGPPRPVPQTGPPVTMGGDATRSALIAAATRTVRCDGEYTLMDDAIIVRVEGSCKRIIVNASGSQVVADDVSSLELIGDSNIVLAGTVREVLVNGDANVVHWTGATPTVSDIGSANTLTAG